MPRNEVVIIWLLIFHILYTSFLLLSAKQWPKYIYIYKNCNICQQASL